jgi:hypothetical protein
MQAQSLKGLIDQAETREGYIGEWRGILCGIEGLLIECIHL